MIIHLKYVDEKLIGKVQLAEFSVSNADPETKSGLRGHLLITSTL